MTRRVLDLPPTGAFTLLSALGEHGRWIPLTTMTVSSRYLQLGDVIVARSAGVFVDRMLVTELDPPRRLALRKIGPVLLGSTSIDVEAAGTGQSLVSWTEDIHLRGPLPVAVSRGLLALPLRMMTALALWRIDRWIHRQQRRN